MAIYTASRIKTRVRHAAWLCLKNKFVQLFLIILLCTKFILGTYLLQCKATYRHAIYARQAYANAHCAPQSCQV